MINTFMLATDYSRVAVSMQKITDVQFGKAYSRRTYNLGQYLLMTTCSTQNETIQ